MYTCKLLIQMSRIELESGSSRFGLKLYRAFFNDLNYLIKFIVMYNIFIFFYHYWCYFKFKLI